MITRRAFQDLQPESECFIRQACILIIYVMRFETDSKYKHKKELAVRPLHPSKAYILRLGLIQTHIRHMKKIPFKRDFFH
jgi:hypothetical protein